MGCNVNSRALYTGWSNLIFIFCHGRRTWNKVWTFLLLTFGQFTDGPQCWDLNKVRCRSTVQKPNWSGPSDTAKTGFFTLMTKRSVPFLSSSLCKYLQLYRLCGEKNTVEQGRPKVSDLSQALPPLLPITRLQTWPNSLTVDSSTVRLALWQQRRSPPSEQLPENRFWDWLFITQQIVVNRLLI